MSVDRRIVKHFRSVCVFAQICIIAGPAFAGSNPFGADGGIVPQAIPVPPGPAAMVALGTATGGSTANIAFTGLVAAAYPRYRLDCDGLTTAAADQIAVQIGEGVTPTWKATGYNYSSVGLSNTVSGTAVAGIFVGVGNRQIDTTLPSAFSVILPGLTGTTLKTARGEAWPYDTTAGAAAHQWVNGDYTADTTAASAIRVTTTVGGSNVITNGTCTLFGLNP